jgi:hypothetical protein
MKSTPYVGITGPVTLDEVRQVGQAFEEAGFTQNTIHVPMIGILASYKTLQGQKTTNKRYPSYGGVQTLLREASNFGLAMVHYNSRERDTLVGQLDTILSNCEGVCNGVQLNIAWPQIQSLKSIRELHSDVAFVIQLSHTAMQGLDPKQIAEKVQDYGNLANYVLIDPSGGRGKEFDIENSLQIYEQLKLAVPDSTIGFAGGFRGENVCLRTRTLRERIGKDFCIDAEGGLRDKITEEIGEDTLNMDKVRSYLKEAARALI